jgi:hypothetical protein
MRGAHVEGKAEVDTGIGKKFGEAVPSVNAAGMGDSFSHAEMSAMSPSLWEESGSGVVGGFSSYHNGR